MAAPGRVTVTTTTVTTELVSKPATPHPSAAATHRAGVRVVRRETPPDAVPVVVQVRMPPAREHRPVAPPRGATRVRHFVGGRPLDTPRVVTPAGGTRQRRLVVQQGSTQGSVSKTRTNHTVGRKS